MVGENHRRESGVFHRWKDNDLKRKAKWQHRRCCALCPFRLTCQRFGMVWDDENAVDMMTKHFPVLYCLLCHFCNIFSLGTFGVSLLGPNPGRAAPLGGGTTVGLRKERWHSENSCSASAL